MQQLARHASGEYLMFTDADTVHGNESIAWAVTNLESHRADCVSGYVFQEMNTLGEQFIVPATYIMSAMLLPLWLIAALPAPGLSFAIGQMLIFRRSAFEAIGGYARVCGQISDDLAMARELKKAGFREVFLDIRRHVRCRMYDGYRASFNGLSKNIYDIARHRSILFAAAVTLLVTFVVLPLALLPIQILTGAAGTARTLLCVAGFLLAWAVVLYDRGLRWWAPLLYPVLFIHLLYMAWWSFAQIRHRAGGEMEGAHAALGRAMAYTKGARIIGFTPHFLPFVALFHIVLTAVRIFDWVRLPDPHPRPREPSGARGRGHREQPHAALRPGHRRARDPASKDVLHDAGGDGLDPLPGHLREAPRRHPDP